MGDVVVFRQRAQLYNTVKKFFSSFHWIHRGVLFHPRWPVLSFEGREPHSFFLIVSLSCLEIRICHLKFQGSPIDGVYLSINSYFFYLLIFTLDLFISFFFNYILQFRIFLKKNSVLTLFFLAFFVKFNCF